MKIKEIIDSNTLRKDFRVYSDFTLVQYINFYKKHTNPSPKQTELYEKCINYIEEERTSSMVRIASLEDIPISVLETLKEEKKISMKVYRALTDVFGCKNMADISTLTSYQVEITLGGAHKTIHDTIDFLNYIQKNPNNIIESWNNTKPICVINDYDSTKSAILQFSECLPQIIETLEKQSWTTMSEVLKMYCLEHMSIEQILAALDKGKKENVVGHLRRFSNYLFAGTLFKGRYSFPSKFLPNLQAEVDSLLYKVPDDIPHSDSISTEAMLQLLDLEITDISDPVYKFDRPIIYRGIADTNLKNIVKIFTQTLGYACFPTDKESLWEDFEARLGDTEIEDKKALFVSLLCHHRDVSYQDGLYMIDGKDLFQYQRIARIVYEQKGQPISKDDVINKYNQLYPQDVISGFGYSGLSEYGIAPVGRTGHMKYGQRMPSLREATRSVIEGLEDIFSVKDVISQLSKKGYKVKEDSIRAYLSGYGYLQDLDHKDIYCHRDKLSDYPDQHRWASNRKYGVQNEILKLLKDKIENERRHSIDLDKARKLVKDWCEKNGVIFHNTYAVINQKYIDQAKIEGDEAKLFYIEGQSLYLNEKVSQNTDWKNIALPGKSKVFSVYAYGLTLELLRKETDKRLQLSVLARKLWEWANTNLPELGIAENTIRKFFDEGAIPAELQRIVTDVGDVFITIPQTAPAANSSSDQEENNLQYVADTKQDNTNDNNKNGIKLVVADVSDRPKITMAETFDWGKIRSVLPRELSFYTKFYPQLINNDTLDKFQQFLEASANPYLNESIPQDLFEYWFAQTTYSLNRKYMSDLARWYEALLKDIYKRKYNQEPHTKSLADICELIAKDTFYRVCLNHRDASNPFEKIFADVHFKRNKEAHGEYLEMSSAVIAKCILDYTALYIYTINEYA